jgi:hypothetical protein
MSPAEDAAFRSAADGRIGTQAGLAAALDATEAFYRRYLALTESQYIAVTLWTAHAHALEATSTTPYLHFTSPEPECGKTRAMECVEALTPKPLYAASMTSAVLYRAIEQLAPTLLIDEADNLMGDREAKRDLFGLLNAGYRRGAPALRMGGGNRDKLERFETFSAKAIAGLDDLVATLASRCVRIEMQRRRIDEPVADFFHDEAHTEAEPIREALAASAREATEALHTARPDRLGVRDRMEEALRLPLAIADMAGEVWMTRAREALKELAGASKRGEASEKLQLLGDIREVFKNRGDPDTLRTAELLDGLITLDEAPWRGWWGVERDGQVQVSRGAARKLGEKLRGFGIRSRDVGRKEKRLKGYVRADLENVWARYLPDPLPDPRNPRTEHQQAKNEATESAHHEPECADSQSPQTRIPEPNARIARIGGESEGNAGAEAQPIVEALHERLSGRR